MQPNQLIKSKKKKGFAFIRLVPLNVLEGLENVVRYEIARFSQWETETFHHKVENRFCYLIAKGRKTLKQTHI